MDDSKQAASSYDRTHRETQDFITDTIAYVDDYLRGERADELAAIVRRDAKDNALMDEWDAEDAKAEAGEWTAEDQAEYAAILDAEEREDWDRRLSRWCQVHDQELQAGKCSACVSEEENERRNDL